MILTDKDGATLNIGDSVRVYFQDTFTHDTISYICPSYGVLTVTLKHGREVAVRIKDKVAVAHKLEKLSA